MNILALQLKRIGDLLLTTPALRALKHASPGTRLTLALAGNTAALRPAMADYVDDALVFPKGAGPGETLALWRRVRRGGFDLCVDFTGNDRSAFLSRLSGAPRRVIARDALRRAPRWRTWAYNTFMETDVRARHTVDRGLDHVPVALGQALAVEASPAPALSLPAAAREQARGALAACGMPPGSGRFAVIHPGSARAEKYWRPERWAEIIRFLQERLNLPCVLTGGRGDPFEDAHLDAVRAGAALPARADLAGKLDLLELAAVIDAAAVFCGVDSGPMHLAAAARVPCVVLFGPTNPFHWRPRHAGTRVLQAGHGDAPVERFEPVSAAGPMEAIPTAAVMAALRGLLLR